MDYEKLFTERMAEAEKGRHIWQKIWNEYKCNNNTYIVLIPSNTEEDIRYTLNILETFKKKKKADKILIMFESANMYRKNESEEIKFIQSDKYTTDCLMRLYTLYRFTSNLIIASLDMPDGRMGKGMLEKGTMCREEIFHMVSFGICKEE